MSKDFLFVRELIHSFELICYHQKIYMWVKIMCKISDFRILISAYIWLRTLQDLHCIFIRTKLFRYLVYLGKIKGKQISTKHENFAKKDTISFKAMKNRNCINLPHISNAFFSFGKKSTFIVL